MKTLRERFLELFQRDEEPAPLNEYSNLHQIALQLPNLYDFVERKYGLLVEPEDRALSLKEFAVKFGLPPAHVIFMEVQMSRRFEAIRKLSARQAREFLQTHPEVKILDVREDWELRLGKLPKSEPLTPEVLDSLLRDCPKGAPLLLYCHFGVRSLDAATFLVDRGFTDVHILTGGIDAWSLDVDPEVPRYDSAYC